MIHMKLREISKPTTVKTLNENLAKMFNTTIDVDTFTLNNFKMLEINYEQN